jgi:hypothetical protein
VRWLWSWARAAPRGPCARCRRPASRAAGRGSTSARRLRLTHAAAAALDPVAERALGGRLRRTLLLSQIVARPWAVGTEDAAAMLRATAQAPGFQATLPLGGALAPGGALLSVTIAWGERDRLLIASRRRRGRGGCFRMPATSCCAAAGHVPMTDDPEHVARVLLEASAGG